MVCITLASLVTSNDFGKLYYPNGHLDLYLHFCWAKIALAPVAHLKQNLSSLYISIDTKFLTKRFYLSKYRKDNCFPTSNIKHMSFYASITEIQSPAHILLDWKQNIRSHRIEENNYAKQSGNHEIKCSPY